MIHVDALHKLIFFLTAAVSALFVSQASALEYTIDGADDYLFGRPTSTDTAYVQENQNVDRSKNTALWIYLLGNWSINGLGINPNLTGADKEAARRTWRTPAEGAYSPRRESGG